MPSVAVLVSLAVLLAAVFLPLRSWTSVMFFSRVIVIEDVVIIGYVCINLAISTRVISSPMVAHEMVVFIRVLILSDRRHLEAFH